MPHPPDAPRQVLSVSRQITGTFALLLIFTNTLLGILLYFQFEQQLTTAWTARFRVPLDNLTKQIEYGLQLGFSLDKMEYLPHLLTKTVRRYPDLTAVFVADRNGMQLAHTKGHADQFPAFGPLLHDIDKGQINGLFLTTARGDHALAWAIVDPFGDTEGYVLMKLPWIELQQLRDRGRNHLFLGIGGIIAGFVLVSAVLFRLLCRNLESSLERIEQCTDRLLAGENCLFQYSGGRQLDAAFANLVQRLGRAEQDLPGATLPRPRKGRLGSNLRARILIGALFLLLFSCLSSTAMGYMIFREIYLPVLYSQSHIVGQSLGELVSEMHGHGIPVKEMRGVQRIFTDLMADFPQIAAIGLYDAQGRRLRESKRENTFLLPESLDPQERESSGTVTIPITDTRRPIGWIRVQEVPYFFAKRLLNIALDAITVLVVSILFASELLTFIVRFLVTVPIEDLVRKLRGEPSLFHITSPRVASSGIHRIEGKVRSLLARTPALPSPPGSSVLQSGSSPLMPYIRPPLFLVVFADALSLSFFPMYVETLSQPVGWLPAGLLMGLPISVFMLVWAVSLPKAGQWSDRVGRRRSFLFGALITTLGLALTAIAQDVIQLILVRSFTAVGYGIVYITAQSYVADHTTASDRTKGMATLLGGFFSGSLCGAALGGILADRIGYQGTFGLSASVSLLAAVFVYHFIGQDDGRRPTASPVGTQLRASDFLQMFRDRCFLPITLLTAIPAKVLLTGFLYYSAPLYLRHIGASQSSAGRLLMLYGLSIILLSPVVAWMADRWHLQRNFIGIGALLSAVALALPSWDPGRMGLLLAILMLGVAHAIALAPQLAVIIEHLQDRPEPPGIGKVIGIFRMSERAGNVLGPMLFGVLLAVAGPEQAFLHVSVYIAVSSLLYFALLGRCQRRGSA